MPGQAPAVTMVDAGSEALEDVHLGLDQLDDLFALYATSLAVAPYGHLAPRTRSDFARMLADDATVVAVGVRDAGRLVAYSICDRVVDNPYPNNPVLRHPALATGSTFHGRGTVVHPRYRGRGLGKRIFGLRTAEARRKGVDHLLALIAADNLAAVSNALVSGGMLIGIAPDETAINFIVYCGRLEGQMQPGGARQRIDWRDREAQERLFAARHLVCALDRSNDLAASDSPPAHGHLIFRPMA